MFWEILLSNLICTSIVGGGIFAYHCYVKYKEQQYYNHLKQQLGEALMSVSQGILYYMVLKGGIDIDQIKNIINTQPHLKQHIPFNFDDISISPVCPMNGNAPLFHDFKIPHESHGDNLYYAPAPMSHMLKKYGANSLPQKFNCTFSKHNNEKGEHESENDSGIDNDVTIKKVSI